MFEGELEKGCGNQVFDYSTTIDLQAFQVCESFSPSPVSSGHNLRGASPQRHDDRKGLEGCSTQLDCSSSTRPSEVRGQARTDMQQDKSHAPLPPITPSPAPVSSSTLRSFIQRSSFELPASEEPLSLRQQLEQPVQLPAPMEQTVTTQPSSSRVAPQWLQPLNRGAPEGSEASRERERPRWLVPQPSVEPKAPTASSSSMLPELPCNPGRVCRGVERTVNGGQWKGDSLDLSCDLLEELGEQMPDRPISGRRSSVRNPAITARQTEEQHFGAAAFSNTGRRGCCLPY